MSDIPVVIMLALLASQLGIIIDALKAVKNLLETKKDI